MWKARMWKARSLELLLTLPQGAGAQGLGSSSTAPWPQKVGSEVVQPGLKQAFTHDTSTMG